MNIELIYSWVANNITVIFTAILALSTIVLAFFTRTLAKEAKKTREFNEEKNQPELSVIITPSERWIHFLFIEIENIGKSPLYNLELKEVKNNFVINSKHNKKIDDMSYIKNIIYLKPQQKINQFLTSIPDEEGLYGRKFSLEFSYKNKKDETIKKIFNFDFNYLKDIGKMGQDSLETISKELNQINNTIKANNKGKERGSNPIEHGVKTRNYYINNLNLGEIKNLLNNLIVSDCGTYYIFEDDKRDILMVYRSKLLIKKELSQAEQNSLSILNEAYKNNFYTIGSMKKLDEIINKIIENGTD